MDLYKQIKASPKDWSKIIKDAENIYPEITKLVSDCEHIKFLAPMLNIRQTPSNDCTTDSQNLVNAGYQFYKDYEAGHVIKYVIDMKKVFLDIHFC